LIPDRIRDFSEIFNFSENPKLVPLRWVLLVVLPRGIKRPVREVYQSPPPSAEVSNKGSYTSALPYALTRSKGVHLFLPSSLPNKTRMNILRLPVYHNRSNWGEIQQ
jgi:hypothetical protein